MRLQSLQSLHFSLTHRYIALQSLQSLQRSIMAEITPDEVKKFLSSMQGQNITIAGLRTEFHILPETKSFDSIRTIIHRLVEQKILKSVGNRGEYRVVKIIEPVNWWDDKGNEDPIDFKFPRCYEDESKFGIEDLVEVFAGDLILVGGFSNGGKTAIALSLMGENLNLMPAVLMGSEYTAIDDKISPKFKRRMKRMNWVKWITDEGKPRFELLPVGFDYEDYIKPDHLNIVDWISLPGEYYLIDSVMKSMKDRVGNGIVVAVLQKNRTAEFPEGGERAERYADVYMAIDPYGNESMLTLGKVKAPKDKATGRMWAFSIVDYGANLYNIREIVKCPKCWGKGYLRSGNNNTRCSTCEGKKYIDK